MKNTNKLVALILTVLMLAGSTVAYAGTYVSDPVSPNISKPAVEEQQPDAGVTPAPEAGEGAVEEQPAGEAPETEAVVTTESENGTVNIRAAASMDAEIVGQLSSNDRVAVLGVEGDWTKIQANGVVGYVFSSYLQVSAPEETPAPEETAADPFVSQYQRNELGELTLDDQGNPIPMTPLEGEAQYLKDAEGNLILDENGEPILVQERASAPEVERSDLSQAVIKTWMDASEDTKFGDTVTIFYEIQNFFGWEYTVHWQRKGADGWSDVPGATGETQSFTLTEENLNTEWRVRVDVVVPEGVEA